MKYLNTELIKKYLDEDRGINGSGAVERLAVKAKLSPTLIRSLARGEAKNIELNTLERLALAMGVDMITLLSGKAA